MLNLPARQVPNEYPHGWDLAASIVINLTTVPIERAGSKLLRWVLVEAAWQLVRRTGRWRAVFEQLAGRIGRKKAIVAVARRLLGVMMALLKSGQPYRHAYAPGPAGSVL